MDNVTQVFNKIGNPFEAMGKLDIPKSVIKDTQERFSTATEKNKATANYYVNYHPYASWDHLTYILCTISEFAAADESKSFISTGKYCHYTSTSHTACAQ